MARRASGGKARAAPVAPKLSAAPIPAAKPAVAAPTERKPTERAARSATAKRTLEDLERELVDARRRIEALEARERAIVDRIAWALDSLHDLLAADE